MNYNGIELKEITEPQIFNPPKEVLVWDDCDAEAIMEGNCDLKRVKSYGIIADTGARVICLDYGDMVFFEHCADIPEKPKPRRATNRELAKWLAQGNGEWGKIFCGEIKKADISWWYEPGFESETLQNEICVRKWGDTEWHEPDVKYMGLEDAYAD